MRDSSTAKAVRVSLPASVAADIGGLKKSLETILGKLGCQACCSGHDILLELQRDYVVRGKLAGRADIGGWAGTAMKRQIPRLDIGLNPDAVASIDGVFDAIGRSAALSGHPNGETGCDIFLQMEQMYVLDAKLNVDEVAMRFG